MTTDRPMRLARPLLLLIAYIGFISIGLPDTVPGVAWPSVRETFRLPQSGMGLIFASLGCGYLVSSILTGKLIAALGIGNLLTLSSLLVALAMFGNALAPVWPMFVVCGIVWGLGSGAIDSGLNAFAASHFSARHVNWLHAFYSLGATLGPLLMTAMLLRAGSWRLGYALVGVFLLAMAVTFLFTRRRWDEPARSAAGESAPAVSMWATIRHPLVQIQIVVFFLYTGLEVMLGQWAFTLLTEARLVRADLAGILVAVYFGAIGVGRVLLGALVERIGLDRLVRLSTLAALLGTLLLAFGSPVEVGMLGLALTGLGLASIFPCLMSGTPQRVGVARASHAIGFQVAAAMIGVGVLPGLAGLIAQRAGLESIALLAVVLALLLVAMHELLLVRSSAQSTTRP